YTPLAGTYRLGGGGGIWTYAPNITGTNQLIIGGSGPTGGLVILSGTNTFTGGLSMVGKGLQITSSTVAANFCKNIGGLVSCGGTLVLGGVGGLGTTSGPAAATVTSGVIQIATTNALRSATVTVSVANGLTFSAGLGTANIGALSGSGAFALTDLGSSAVTLQT